MSPAKRIRIAVVGASASHKDELDAAHEVGKLLAGRGCIVITGGMAGVMEAASRGASEAGGTVVGILPDSDDSRANEFVGVPIPTGLGYARNVLVVRASHGVIAVGGKVGTLSEIAFALNENIPVVGIGTWEFDEVRLGRRGVISAESPADAVGKILELVSSSLP